MVVTVRIVYVQVAFSFFVFLAAYDAWAAKNRLGDTSVGSPLMALTLQRCFCT